MQKVKVIVERQVTETWEFFLDADALGIPPSDKGLTPGQYGDACDALHELINGTRNDPLFTEELTDVTAREESIITWHKVSE